MKSIRFLGILLSFSLLFIGCHRETELEKVVRQANKKCPITITDGMRLDSIVIHKVRISDTSEKQSLSYYVTLFGIYEEEWMKDVVEANLAGLNEREASALLAQGLRDDPQFAKLLQASGCSLSMVLQYSDGRRAKTFDIVGNGQNLIDVLESCDSLQGSDVLPTMDFIRRDVQNSAASCPMQIADGIVMQSVSLDSTETIVSYVFRISGDDLTPESVDRTMLEGLQQTIAADLETNPAMRIYRDNGITIRYRFENVKGELLYGFDF